jgi:transposase-like protein
MGSISDKQKEQIIALLSEGQLSREEIATKVNVSP